MNTQENYTHEKMMADHMDTVRAVFGTEYLVVTDEEVELDMLRDSLPDVPETP